MMGPPPSFEIRETDSGGTLRLTLTGELDVGTSPILEERLTRLRARKSPVRLNLSKLEFIDSTGLHLLVRMVGDARIKHWQFQIEPEVTPQVMRVLRLTHLDAAVMTDDAAASS